MLNDRKKSVKSIDKILKNGPNIEDNKYLTDTPITDIKDDRFNRLPIALGIIDIIKNCSNQSNIVIGIYGEWGSGKTTVLNFVESKLNEDKENYICFKFNPWRYTDEDTLLLSFFQTLSKNLKKSLSKKTKEIARLLDEYPIFLSSISTFTNLGLGLIPGAGAVTQQVLTKENLQGIIKKYSSNDLDKNKKEINDFLAAQHTKVVILIDDIDRLDKKEIQSIFKLVKLTADFKNTVYLLAFDENIVASALGEMYSSDNDDNLFIDNGKSFIEKIVQVPIRLPLLDTLIFREYSLDLIKRSLSSSHIDISDDQWIFFKNTYINGLETRVKNARMIIRYANSLLFSLSVLRGHVNTVDLLLIEGIRIFYPDLYGLIVENKEYFVDSKMQYTNSNRYSNYAFPDQNDIIEKSLSGLTNDEKEAARYILGILFPRIYSKGDPIGPEFEFSWADDKRIASVRYFDSYFIYGSPRPLSQDFDFNTEQFLINVKKNKYSAMENLRNLLTVYNSDVFLTKLYRHMPLIQQDIIQDLAIVIASISYKFPDRQITMSGITTLDRAVNLVKKLIAKIQPGEYRQKLVTEVFRYSENFYFTYKLYKVLTDDMDGAKLINDEDRDICYSISGKIDTYISRTTSSIFNVLPDIASDVLLIWSKGEANRKAGDYLKDQIRDNSYNALIFIKSLMSHSEHPNEHVVNKDFLDSHFDKLKKIIDAKIIYDALSSIFNEAQLVNGDINIDNDDKRIAKQFFIIYNNMKTQ